MKLYLNGSLAKARVNLGRFI